MVTARAALGVIDGIDRPALAAVLPGLGRRRLLLDVGANVSCRVENYREFALMGHFYAQEVLGIDRPKIGLLSVGEEEEKGTGTTREVFGLLRKSGLNFVGNCEGRDVYGGNVDVDVVVTDGFTGNVVLKVSESLAQARRGGPEAGDHAEPAGLDGVSPLEGRFPVLQEAPRLHRVRRRAAPRA